MSCGKFVEKLISEEKKEIKVEGYNKCLLQNLCTHLDDPTYSFQCIKTKVLFANIQYNDEWLDLFPPDYFPPDYPDYKKRSQLMDKIFSFEIVFQQKVKRNDSFFGKTFGITDKDQYSFKCYFIFIDDNTPTIATKNDFECWRDSILETFSKEKNSMYKNIPKREIIYLNKIDEGRCHHLSENEIFIKNINIIIKKQSEGTYVPGFKVNAGSKKRKNKKTKTRKNKKRKSMKKKNHK